MPLLARMLSAPLVIDVRPGAICGLGDLLADRRIASGGPGRGRGRAPARATSIAAELEHRRGRDLPDHRRHATAAAVALGERLRAGSYEAVAGIGGGRTIDVTKFAAHMAGIPMVAVATNLAHDGIASPVSSLEHESGKGSYGVVMPVAVVVDLDRVRARPDPLASAGIGDVVSNLSAIADWELAAADTGEPVDGLAVAMARSAAQAVLHQPGHARSDEFLTVLAEALVLSGLAMAVAGSSRPCSGGDHEIMHAIDQLYPGTGSHGELAGRGRAVLRLPAGGPRAGRADLGLPGPARAAADPGRSRAVAGGIHQGRRAAPRPPGPAGTRSWSASACPRRRSAERVEEYARAFAG